MERVDSGAATPPSLLLRLRNTGDVNAWETFVEVYGPLVYGECRRRGLTHADGEDVTQRVFARIIVGIRKLDYDRARGRFRDWLGTIVRNEVWRLRREHDRHPAGRPGPSSDQVEQLEGAIADPEWAERFQAHVLAAGLDRIRPGFELTTWRAFELTWRQGRSATEAASELGQSIDWVYVAKSRVLKALRIAVEELAEDIPF